MKLKINHPKIISVIAGLCLIGIISGLFVLRMNKQTDDLSLNPKDFSSIITNTYFSLPVGLKLVYEAQTAEGLEKNEIEITGETKNILGIDTLVYHDTVWLNNVLSEETWDYLAQHKNGDVWYFGEDVDNYDKSGALVNHAGSWMAGVNGAMPGFWVKQNPQVGESYRQEYYPGEAEDMATVLSLNEQVTVPFGTYTNCLKTHDWTPLNPAALENKYYCPQVHAVVLEEDTASGEKVQLIDRVID